MATKPNPYLDNEEQNVNPTPDAGQPDGGPSLLERFRVNATTSFWDGTLAGSGIEVGMLLAAQNDPIEHARVLAAIRDRTDEYTKMKSWNSFWEGGAALAGSIAGAIPTPENFIPVPGSKAAGIALTKALPLARTANVAVSAARPRIVGAMTQGLAAAGVNALTDPIVQGLNIYKGSQEQYSPLQTAIGAAAGFGIGGIAGALFPGSVGDITPGGSTRRVKPAPPVYITEAELGRIYGEMSSSNPDLGKAWKKALRGKKEEILTMKAQAKQQGFTVRRDPNATLYDLYITHPDLMEAVRPELKKRLDDLFDSDPSWKSIVDEHRSLAQERIANYTSTIDGTLNALRHRQAALSENPEPGQTYHEQRRAPLADKIQEPVQQGQRPHPSTEEVAHGLVQRIQRNMYARLTATGDDTYAALLELLDDGSNQFHRIRRTAGTLPNAAGPTGSQASRAQYLISTSQALRDSALAVHHATGIGDPAARPLETLLEAFMRSPQLFHQVDPTMFEKLGAMLARHLPEDLELMRQAARSVRTPIRPGSKMKSELDQGMPHMASPARPMDGVADNLLTGKRLGQGWETPPSPATISDTLSKGLGFDIRQGKIKGTIRYNDGILRIRHINDMQMIIAGAAIHATQTMLARMPENFTMFSNAMARQLRELTNTSPLFAAAAESVPDMTDKASVTDFTNFLYLYVANRPLLNRKFKPLVQEFERFFGRYDPNLVETLNEASDQLGAWLTASSSDALAARIHSAAKKPFLTRMEETVDDLGYGTTIGAMMHKSYQAVVDDHSPIFVAVRNLARLYLENTGRLLNLPAANDPAKLAALARNASNAGAIDLQYGVVPYKGIAPEGPSLVEALETAFGTKHWDEDGVELFGKYLAAMRLAVEWNRYDAGRLSGFPDMEPTGSVLRLIDELEAIHPNFRAAAEMVNEFNANMWKKKYEAGFIKPEVYEATVKERAFYAPLMRDVDKKTRLAVASMSKDGSKGVVFRFDGSDQDIINPIHSMMLDAYATAQNLARNDVYKALEDLMSQVGFGASRIVERISTANAADGQGVGRVATPIDNLHLDNLDPRDAGVINGIIANSDEAPGMWRASGTTERGDDIIYVWRNGKRYGLRMADGEFGRDLHYSLTHMAPDARDVFMKIVAKPTALLSAGITGTPEFALANLFRDQIASWILSEHFTPGWTVFSGMKSEISKDVSARIYNQTGGLFGGSLAAASHESRVKADLAELKRKGYLIESFTSVKGFFRMFEITETGNRLGIFKNAFEAHKKNGLTDYEAAVEATYTARDILDYGRRGSRMQHATRLILFLNPYLQGLDKLNRTAIRPIIRHLRGDILTEQEAREVPAALKALSKMVAIGMIGATLSYLYADDEEYNAIGDYYRATHWMARGPNGKWISIPKPFELAVFSNFFERSVEAAYRDNALAKDRMLRGVVDVITPPVTNPIYKVGTGLLTGIDPETGREIVSPYQRNLAPYRQYSTYTSELAKALGKATNTSPAMIDYGVINIFGSRGRDVLHYTNFLFDAKRPADGYDDTMVSRRFIRDWSRGSLPQKEFWDRVNRRNGRFEQAANEAKSLLDQGDNYSFERYIAELPEDAREYAVMATMGGETAKMHPMIRAGAVARALSKVRREVIDNEEAYVLHLRPQQKQMIDDILSKVSVMEMHNALVITRARGFESRKLFAADDQLKLIKDIDKNFGEEVFARLHNSKIVDFDIIRKQWPIIKESIKKAPGVQPSVGKDGAELIVPGSLSAKVAESQLKSGIRTGPNIFLQE